jgi:thiopurine S-methyltransferase
MEPSFWHDRWATQNIAFHRDAPNEHLVRHWPSLGIPKGSRVFVPLCGKTLDLPWLASQGYRVAGAELSPLAVQQFFDELGVKPSVQELGKLRLYQAPAIDFYAGDLFDLTPELLGPVDAIYDRAALVALPAEMRRRYTAQLLALGRGAPQLLVTYAYDQALAEGPPFSVPAAEVEAHYSAHYRLERLAQAEVEGGMRGKTPAQELVWRLARP